MSRISTDKKEVPLALQRLKLVEQGLADRWAMVQKPSPMDVPPNLLFHVRGEVDDVRNRLRSVKDDVWNSIHSLALTHARILQASGDLDEASKQQLEDIVGGGPVRFADNSFGDQFMEAYKDAIDTVGDAIDAAGNTGAEWSFQAVTGSLALRWAFVTWAGGGFRGSFADTFRARRAEILATPGIGVLRWASGIPVRMVAGVGSLVVDVFGIPAEWSDRFNASRGNTFTSRFVGAGVGAVLDFGFKQIGLGAEKAGERALAGDQDKAGSDKDKAGSGKKAKTPPNPIAAIVVDGLQYLGDNTEIGRDIQGALDRNADGFVNSAQDLVTAGIDAYDGDPDALNDVRLEMLRGTYGEMLQGNAYIFDPLVAPLLEPDPDAVGSGGSENQ
jgi:hypothetical protein